MSKRKLILRSFLSPGDIVTLSAAVRDIHQNYPDEFLTDVRTSANEIFENNPYITELDEDDADTEIIECNYDLIHRSNDSSHHFIHGYTMDIEDQLGLKIRPGHFWGDIHLSDQEKSWLSQFYEEKGYDSPFWIIDAGCKHDYTAKQWHYDRFQAVVDYFKNDIQFVQMGSSEHIHPQLRGENILNLIGKTDLRQLIRLIYHSAGVLTPVSLPMHLARAVEVKPHYKRGIRPCVVIAGSREPSQWEKYGEHVFFSNNGSLTCSSNPGGCWKSRSSKLNDGDSKDNELCLNPVDLPTEFDTDLTFTKSGEQKYQTVPKCLSKITAEEVIKAIHDYMEEFDYHRNIQYDEKGAMKLD